jgi:hypothetical protein
MKGRPRNRWQDEVREDGSLVGGEGKLIPLRASTDPEVSRRLRLPDFMTIGT